MEGTVYLIVVDILEEDEYGNEVEGVQVIECFLDEEMAKQFAGTQYDYRVKEMKLGDYKYAHVKEKRVQTNLSISMEASFCANTKEFSEFVFTTGKATRGQNPTIKINIETEEVSFELPKYEATVSAQSSPNDQFVAYHLFINVPISSDKVIQNELKERWENEIMDIFFIAIDLFEEHGCHHENLTSTILKGELEKRNLLSSIKEPRD